MKPVYVIGKYFNRPFAMGPDAVPKLIGLSVPAPLAAGMVFRKVAPGTAERIADPLARIAGIVLLGGVLCILALSLPAAWALIGNGTIIAFIAFAIVGLTVAHFFGGPGSGERVTRTRWMACRSSWSSVLIGTKRMFCRATASAIASASRKSFLLDFTNGLTNCAGISRTSCPCDRRARPRKCAPEQASNPTRELRPGWPYKSATASARTSDAPEPAQRVQVPQGERSSCLGRYQWMQSAHR